MGASQPEWSVPAMAACAVAIRSDWDPDQTTGALLAVQGTGEWSPCRALSLLARTLADPGGSPRDLIAAVQDPRRRSRPADPEAARTHIAQARAALNRPRTSGHAA